MRGIIDWLKDLALALRKRLSASAYVFLIGIPIIVVGLALGAYGMWWRTLADGVRQNVVEFQSSQRVVGRDVSWDRFNLEGFPYRIEASILKPKFLAPDRGTAWNGDRVVMHVDPFSVGNVGLSLEGLQSVTYVKDGLWIELSGSADKALVGVAAGLFGPERLSLDVAMLTGNAKINATDFNFIIKEAAGGLSVTAAADVDDLPRVDFKALLKNVALQGKLDLPLGPTIDLFNVEVAAKFPTNVPEASSGIILAEWRRTGTPVEIKSFELEWGGISISATGEFKLDDNAMPEGAFQIRLGNHARILELLRERAWITPETFAAAKPALDVLAFISGDPQRRIHVPLRIEKGDVFIGPKRVATFRNEPTPVQPAPAGVPADVVVPEASVAQPKPATPTATPQPARGRSSRANRNAPPPETPPPVTIRQAPTGQEQPADATPTATPQ